jgi:hypothetical protein
VAEDSALSGLVVLVPEAEPVVGRHRLLLDDNAARGPPAHVTVLFPFAAPSALDEPTLARVARAVGAVPAFDHAFTETAWFGDDVLWLAPVDPEVRAGLPVRGRATEVALLARDTPDDRWVVRARFPLSRR